MMECKKKKTPPWKHHRPSTRKAKEIEYKALHQQFMDLQLDWDSIKCSKIMPKILLPSSPTTYSSNASVVASLQLLDKYSPGTLMSFLQQKRSPSSDRAWKVRNNDLAIEEILRDRRAAIESGKLKGRRLFESLESATVIGLESSVRPESEVRSLISKESDDNENENSGDLERLTHVFGHSSCSSLSSSSDCEGELDKGEELVMRENVMKTSNIENRRGIDDRAGRRRRWIVVIHWLLIGSIICAVGIVSTKIVNGCQDHKVTSFVPT